MRLIDADALGSMVCLDIRRGTYGEFMDGSEVSYTSREVHAMINEAPTVDAGPTWISVEDRLPEVEKRVLVSITRHSLYKNKDYTLITCAIYEDGKVNVEDSCWTCEDGDYDEEADVSRVPQGWYEFHEYGNTEEDGIGLIGGDSCLVEKVTHWMPLPEPPKEG